MVQPKQVVFVSYLEMHLFGDYISVCWNMNREGNRDGDSPRIVFSSTEGGVTLIQANQVQDELKQGIKYLEQLNASHRNDE